MDPRIIRLYDEYTHKPLDRRVFFERLATLAGGVAAASALLPLLENNYAQAAIVDPTDPRLTASTISYKGAAGDVRAYLALPTTLALPTAGPAKRAGVIVVHENRGLNPHIQDVARRVAVEGFTALAPDLLSATGGTPADEDAARDAIAKLGRRAATPDLVAAIDYLKSRTDAAGPVGAVGFCWGGGMVNQLAVHDPNLAAAVPFYGEAPAAVDVPHITAKIQAHYGGEDERIDAGIPGFESALKAAGKSYEIFVYPGADHAFHNDTNAGRYNKDAAELAWSRTVAFLKANLRASST